jgi:hypothetical protein
LKPPHATISYSSASRGEIQHARHFVVGIYRWRPVQFTDNATQNPGSASETSKTTENLVSIKVQRVCQLSSRTLGQDAALNLRGCPIAGSKTT